MAKKVIQVVYQVNDKDLLAAQKTIDGIEKEAKQADTQVKKLGDDMGKAGKQGSDSFLNMKNVIGAISFAGIAAGLTSIISQSIKVTSEFQKFSAVLTNTLGSKSAAQKALQDIKNFAATTPFSVQELTASFVKLANQGFKPTIKELTKLGDLASSQGKGFDQLTEAIIDAQVGEFERLKEFGVRAQKEGDNVTFTFKGVKQQVDFTAESIQKYVLSLGDAEGVTGGMAAISKTLGGQISNLGDSYDTFLATLGEGNNGALSGSVSLLSKALEIATKLVKTYEQQAEENSNVLATAAMERFKSFTDEEQKVNFINNLYQRKLELQTQIAAVDRLNTTGRGTVPSGAAFTNYFPNKEQIVAIDKTIEMIRISNTEQTKTVEVVKKLTAEEKKLADERAKNLKAAADFDPGQSKARQDFIDAHNPFFTIDEDALNKVGEDAKKILEDQYDAEFQVQKDANDRALQQEADHQNKIKELKLQATNFAIDLIGQILLKNDDSITKQLEAEREFTDTQISLAGDNEKRKEEIQIESNLRQDQLRKEQASKEKTQARKKILIDGLVAIAKTFAELGFPAGIIPAALMAAETAALAITVGKYKDGGWIDGPGTTTSDSIPILASRDEFMVKASAAKMAPNLLQAINDRKIDDRVLSKLKVGANGIIANLNDKGIIKAIQDNKGPSLSREGYALYETIEGRNGFKRKIRSKQINS